MAETSNHNALDTELNRAKQVLFELGKEHSHLVARRDETASRRLPSGDELRMGELSRLIGDAKTTVADLQAKVEFRDRDDNWKREVSAAPGKVKAARKAMESCTKQAAGYGEKAARLRERIEAIEADSRDHEERAAEAEATAANASSASVSSGDAAAEAAAFEKLQLAQAGVAGVKAGAAANASLLASLRTALQAQEQLAKDARDEAETHEAQMHLAMVIGLRADWDSKVDELVLAGARLLEAVNLAGHGSSGLSEVRIPRFAPNGGVVGERFLGIKMRAAQDTQ